MTPAQPVRVDPAFLLTDTKRLRADPRVSVRDAYRHATIRVARNAHDLRAHLQRIQLLIDSDQPDRLFGAVVDLFVALGKNGLELRSDVIERAGAHLDQGQVEYLKSHLATGLDRSMTLPVIAGSVLDRGALGSFNLVARVRAEAPAPSAADLEDPFYVPPELAARA